MQGELDLDTSEALALDEEIARLQTKATKSLAVVKGLLGLVLQLKELMLEQQAERQGGAGQDEADTSSNQFKTTMRQLHDRKRRRQWG